MRPVDLVRRTAFLVPLLMTIAVVLMPAPGYEQPKDFAAVACLALLTASSLTHTDGLHTASMAGLAVAIGLGATQFGLVLSFAAIVSLVVIFEFVSRVRSLFGLTDTKVELLSRSTISSYLEIIRRQAVRSSSIGFATLLISLAVVSTPTPLLAFTNPVSGSGLLALSTINLIVLVASGMGVPRLSFKRNPKTTQS